jgi:Fe-S-cluster-containing hydrogenase component 2
MTTLAHKCDLCVDHEGGPACIPVCPTKALYLVAPDEVESITTQRREQALAGLSAAENR